MFAVATSRGWVWEIPDSFIDKCIELSQRVEEEYGPECEWGACLNVKIAEREIYMFNVVLGQEPRIIRIRCPFQRFMGMIHYHPYNTSFSMTDLIGAMNAILRELSRPDINFVSMLVRKARGSFYFLDVLVWPDHEHVKNAYRHAREYFSPMTVREVIETYELENEEHAYKVLAFYNLSRFPGIRILTWNLTTRYPMPQVRRLQL